MQKLNRITDFPITDNSSNKFMEKWSCLYTSSIYDSSLKYNEDVFDKILSLFENLDTRKLMYRKKITDDFVRKHIIISNIVTSLNDENINKITIGLCNTHLLVPSFRARYSNYLFKINLLLSLFPKLKDNKSIPPWCLQKFEFYKNEQRLNKPLRINKRSLISNNNIYRNLSTYK